jgi:hypothetical protein
MGAFYHNISQNYVTNNASIILTHGRQSENKDYLGMAIVAPSNAVSYTGATPNESSDILNTYISAQNINSNKPCLYRYYAGWEKTDVNFASLDYFKSMLSKEAMKLSVPIQIK